MAKHIIMSCPLYDVEGRGAVGSAANYHILVSTQNLESITSRLIKKGLLVQYSVVAEQLYRIEIGITGSYNVQRKQEGARS